MINPGCRIGIFLKVEQAASLFIADFLACPAGTGWQPVLLMRQSLSVHLGQLHDLV